MDNENVTGSNTNDESVLDGLQPHSNLKTLNVEGFRGKNFPSWAMDMSKLANLIKVEFVNCFTCEEVPMLGHLPLRKYLTLEKFFNVRSIGQSFYGARNCSSKDGLQMTASFPSLKSLIVRDLQNLTVWEEVETNRVQVFPCLERLVIESCTKLKTAPSNFLCLKKLDINGVESDLLLINILSSRNLTSLVELSIRNAWKLTLLPDDLCYRNQNLAMLDLSFNPMLAHIPHLRACALSLRRLLIQVCASLRELPNDVYLL